MKVGYRLGIGLLIAVTIAGGTGIGILVNRGLNALPSAHDKPVAQLIRDLKKRDSGLDTIWQSIWPLLPTAFSGTFPSLAPRNAALIRLEAAEALQSQRQDTRPAIPALLMTLNDADLNLRLAALKALEELGPSAESALPALIAVLRQTNSPSSLGTDELRGAAALALAAMAPKDVRVIALLRDSLHSEVVENPSVNFTIGSQIVSSLERVAQATNVAVPILIAALENSGIEFIPSLSEPPRGIASLTQEQVVQWSQARQAQEERISLSENIIASLGRIGPKTPEVIPTLLRALNSRTDPIRLRAVQAFGLCGSNALPALPALLQILDETRSAPEPKTPEPSADRRFGVMPTTSNFGQNLSWGVPTLLPTVVSASTGILSRSGVIPHSSRPSQLHSAVLHSLGEIGPLAQDAFRALNAECGDTNRSFRFEAAIARWKIDRDTNNLRSVLRDGLVHPQIPVRSKVSDFLGQIGVEALPELAAALTNDVANIRIRAMNSLAALGPAAQSVGPILERSLTDPKYIVRKTAEKTLKAIRASGSSTTKP